jgi:hypothetical protein
MTSGGTIKGLSPNLKAWIRDVGRFPPRDTSDAITMRLGVHLQGERLAAHIVVLSGRDEMVCTNKGLKT